MPAGTLGAKDFVGLFVLALACGLGGGLLRDGLFIQAGPPAAMRDGSYMLAVVASLLGVAGFGLLTRVFHIPLVMSALAAIAITFVIRMLAISFDWKTRPVVPPPPSKL